MLLPSVEQYSAIIEKKDPRDFSFLNDYSFLFTEKEGKKEYCFSVGTCAAVFKAHRGTEDFAIRCFLRGELETFRRYEQLDAFLSSKDLSWKVDFDLLDNGIQVEGRWFPVVKMDWVYGIPLNKFVDEAIGDPGRLTELQHRLVTLSKDLEETGIGHGDLKYNNIFIQKQGPDFTLKLIDYDSMFIPAFRGRNNLEPGSPGFQHPRRLSTFFSETIDRFSIWVLLTVLEVIKIDPALWRDAEQDDYTNSEHSLFTVIDFINPATSRLFQKLKSYNNDDLNYYLNKLIAACSVRDLNTIEKPELYKEYATAFSPKPAPAPPPVIPVPAQEERRYGVEIKTIPAGKDVLVHEIKKGITPLLLQLLKNDFEHVVVVNEEERIPVPVNERTRTYEFDFSQKIKETIPPPPPVEQDEIIEFRADKYTVQEGELATINWKVRGDGKIYISNMGEMYEKVGAKKVVLKNTTDYVLTIGSRNRSLTINVQPKPQPIPVQRHTIVEETKAAASVYPVVEKGTVAPRQSNKILLVVLILMAVVAISFFAFNYLSNNKNITTNNKETNTPPKGPLFTQSSVTSFLSGLYNAYNNRELTSIMSNYSPVVNEYYDSKSLTKDSLTSIVKNLFITPASYNCTPDFKTLIVQPQDQNCKVIITINEKLKSDNNSSTDNYTTTIEYLLDPSYKIISEKSPGT
jgi:hypothetical protein